jgi:hypothetical protein
MEPATLEGFHKGKSKSAAMAARTTSCPKSYWRYSVGGLCTLRRHSVSRPSQEAACAYIWQTYVTVHAKFVEILGSVVNLRWTARGEADEWSREEPTPY